MESSTLCLIITLFVAIIFLRWVISPIPQSVPDEFDIPDPVRQPIIEGTPSRRRREVTESMIEVVQAIAPHISKTEISRSLTTTGSVEATIEMLLETGPLIEAVSSETPQTENGQQYVPQSLLDRYGVKVEGSTSGRLDGQWGNDESEREIILQRRKAEMILRARSSIKDTSAIKSQN